MTNETRARLRRLMGCRVLWATISCSIVYIVLGLTLPRQPFLELVRILQSCTAIIVAIAFSADAWDSVTSERYDRTDSLVVGIFLQHISLFWIGFWLLLYRLSGPEGARPEWMLNTMTFGFWGGWLSCLASVMHVWAPGVLRRSQDGEEVPPPRLRAVGIAAAIGVFGILWVLSAQPNVQWLVENMQPYVR